ncbi:MAG: hypothetical protein IJR82_03570 [Bacilli bacterium]|nr:hypothetical protein [Bacilli bacterium]
MNRIVMLLPNPMLKRYVLNHFSELSVDEFFRITKRISIPAIYIMENNVLNSNPTVLSYMLDLDKDSFDYFEPEAFSMECVNKIADLDVKIYSFHINRYPILLNNPKICESSIKEYPSFLKKLDGSQITKNIISILENADYTPDEEDINKSHLFLKNEKLMKNAISENPILILRIDEPSDELINTAFYSGFVPEKTHFVNYPYLMNNEKLLNRAFEYDPSIIAFFKPEQINYESILSARKRGFIATKADLLKNKGLRKSLFMEDAIKKDPSLITLLDENCFIDMSLIKESLKKYPITKEDLEKNPELTKNYSLMSMLPEFSLYSAYLTDEEKEENIASCLYRTYTLTTSDLPFLDSKFGGKADIEKLNELLKYFNISLDESDLNIQQQYLQVLDQIIDGIVNIRYTKSKSLFKYSDIVSLNDSLIKLFESVASTNNYELILQYIKELHSFIGESISIELLKSEIEKFYHFYISNHSIDLSVTSEFCNKILNQHRNHFMSNEKSKILANIEKKMKLTEKKKTTILNGRKIIKIEKCIKKKDYQQLGITEEQLMNEINSTINSIVNNKDIRKLNIQFDISKINQIVDTFKYYGRLDVNRVNYILGINDSEVSKFIVRKFEQIKFKYIDIITLTEEESQISQDDRSKLGGLNQSNYVIDDSDRCIKNLSEILVNIDEETVTKILDKKELIRDVSFLLPVINLIDELDVKTFINILANYDRIKSKFLSTIDVAENINFTTIVLKKIDDLIFLANAYSSTDDIALFALGSGVVSRLEEYDISNYLKFYIQMANRQNGSIPPISLQTQDYYLESGMYSDSERLLIGMIPKKNCIDICNCAGAQTYNELLLQKTGDVILIRNTQKIPISRILIFRRGNVIQMTTRAGDKLPMNLYKTMADQIMQQSISNNDNIDYVFVNIYSVDSQDDTFISVKDFRFSSEFPHADFSDSVLLLSSKRKMQGFEDEKLELDFHVEPKCLYLHPRKKISYQPTDDEITRLRALKIVMETNSEVKENASRDFEPFYSREYAKVICGEDWYIAIKNDGTIEEIILPIKDDRMLSEIKHVKSTLGIDSKNEDFEETIMNKSQEIKH